ncbi:MAG: HAD-IIA family hydrolase [Pseudomonadota bacterium]|nr:HAD-IIA family hydrolase [Pseudomonadota bacterium]
MDGKPIPRAIEAVKKAQKHRRVFFCTNNSSRSRTEYAQSLNSFGIDCGADSILSSTAATIAFLKSRRIGSLFVLGTPSLQKELQGAGFIISDTRPDMVIVGFDKTLAFETASRATQLIAGGCPYILTHPDVACPTAAGPIPDAGAIGAMIETATGVKPIAVLGKPSRDMLSHLFKPNELAPHEVVMIGDRLVTDTQMALNAGCLSVLVLSGITSRLDVENSSIVPSLIIQDAGKLLDFA